MGKKKRQEDRERYPVIVTIDDILIIGTQHDLDLRKHKGLHNSLTRRLATYEHLLTEGDGNRPNTSRIDYLLPREFRGEVHHLEEGYDGISDILRYGFPERLLGMWKITECGFSIVGMNDTNGNVTLNDLIRGFNIWKSICPGYQRFDGYQAAAATHKLQTYAITRFGNDAIFYQYIDACSDFEAKIRDRGYIGPNSIRLCKELTGRKAVLIGRAHLDYLVPFLEGKDVEPMSTWAEHVSSLDEPLRSFALDIESNLFPPKFLQLPYQGSV